MMTMTELFYGPVERTWIVHPWRPYAQCRNVYTQYDGRCPACATVEHPRDEVHVVEPEFQTVHFLVPLCCDKCVATVKKELLDLDDVERVTCDQWKQQVSVTSSVAPEKLLKRLQKIKKRSAFWPQPCEEQI